MITLSIEEAQDFFTQLNPKHILFSTENQEQYTHPNYMSIITRYKEILFSKFTNRVCLRSGDDILCLSKVKCIKIDEKPSIGITFYILCSDKRSNSGVTSFVFIAAK